MAPGTSDFWKRLDDLFNEAMDLAPDLRCQFVERACGDDRKLHAELTSLLRSAEATEPLENLIHNAAHDFLAKKPLLSSGALVGGYEIVSLLGAGGMGRVYLAHDPRLRRKVAIKTLTPESIHDEESLRRFEQEALAASALNHPNILTIYEVGESDGIHFIASEFVDGFTVRERLSSGRLSVEDAVDIAIQTAAGLTAAHGAGIVHRDIKPENIVIRRDGLVKIVDFGIAKLNTESPARPSESRGTRLESATQPGMVLGTAKYMSPEQARGLAVDNRTDLFSLGAVLHEMIAGKAPFEGATISDVIAEILKSDPPPLDQTVPETPRELARIVGRAMHKDRQGRYQSAKNLVDELQSFKQEREFRAKIELPPAVLSTRRKLIIGAVALIASTILGVGYFSWSRSPTPSIAIRRLAILPFRNIRQDAATDFLGFSLADAVITKLGYVSSVSVRPSSSIDQYRNRTIDPRKVGAELKVDALLTGSFIKDGDDLRINTQLIDVKQMRMIWQDTIDIKYERLLTVEDRVAQRIISGLELSLSPTETGNLKLDNPINRAAYEDYLRGVDLYALSDYASAVQVLERSASEAPDYALTWAHLGRAYTTEASLQFGGREMYRKALAAYQKALALNPALINARIYMSNLFTDTGRAEEAVPLMRGALQNNRNNAEAHWELGYAFRFGGLLPESIAECERARQIAPAVKIGSSALNSYLYVGEYDKFLASLPPNGSAYLTFYRGFAEYYKRDYQNAAIHFDRAYELDPALLQAEVGKAIAEHIRNRNAAGLAMLRETEAKIAGRGVADSEGIYKVCEAYALLGDDVSALRMFRQTIAGGFFCYPYFQTDPLIDSIRRERDFATLMDQARRRHEAFKAKFSGPVQ